MTRFLHYMHQDIMKIEPLLAHFVFQDNLELLTFLIIGSPNSESSFRKIISEVSYLG